MSITLYMTIEIIQYNGMHLHWSLVQVLFTFFLYFMEFLLRRNAIESLIPVRNNENLTNTLSLFSVKTEETAVQR